MSERLAPTPSRGGLLEVEIEARRQLERARGIYPPTGDGVRLGLAAISDGLDDALRAWRREQRDTGWAETRSRLAQALATGIRLLDSLPEAGGAGDAGADGPRRLRGRRIREEAVRVLVEEASGPIHYREWYERLLARGFVVEAKRPDAAFLGAVVRSPLVKATTRRGFYELDEAGPARIRRRLASARERLAELASAGAECQEEAREVGRLEKARGEIERCLLGGPLAELIHPQNPSAGLAGRRPSPVPGDPQADTAEARRP